MRQESYVLRMFLPCLVVSRVYISADRSGDGGIECVGQNCFGAFDGRTLFFDGFADYLTEDDKFVNELINIEADPNPSNAMLARHLRP